MEYGALRDAAPTRQDVAPVDPLAGNVPPPPSGWRLVSTPVPAFNCPSRRPATTYRVDIAEGHLAVNAPDCSHSSGCYVARGDYRANSGNRDAGDQEGPSSYASSASSFLWLFSENKQNGVSFQRSSVRIAEIIDGTSRTALVGEKYLDPNHYEDGIDKADNQCIFSGHDSDNNGYTADGNNNGNTVMRPRQDAADVRNPHYFGSAHAIGFHMAYCDGSVHSIRYDVDDQVWIWLGGRDDEQTL
jgi:hypothetical protein